MRSVGIEIDHWLMLTIYSSFPRSLLSKCSQMTQTYLALITTFQIFSTLQTKVLIHIVSCMYIPTV